jgi:hypothetical protein
VKTFRQYIFEKYTFGGTAFGLASVDSDTVKDQERADAGMKGYEGFNQRVGSSGRAYIPAFSVASSSDLLPAGTYIKVTDKRTGEPYGKQFGNDQGIYRVDGTGGPQTENNIDFFSGDNKAMYDYYAGQGPDKANLQVDIINMTPNSTEEQQIIAKVQKGQSGLPSDKEDVGGQALASLQQNAMNVIGGSFNAASARDALKSVLAGAKGAIGSALPAGTRLPF